MTPAISTVHKYLTAFANKDADRLSSLLAIDVTLRDWTLFEEGQINVVAAATHIFDSCSTISVVLLNLVSNGKVAVAEVDICFDGGEPIRVVDVYEFDGVGKIVAIRAFKG